MPPAEQQVAPTHRLGDTHSMMRTLHIKIFVTLYEFALKWRTCNPGAAQENLPIPPFNKGWLREDHYSFGRNLVLLVLPVFLLGMSVSAWSKESPQALENQASELTVQAINMANKGDFDQALTVFDKVLKLSNRHVPALFNRGKVLLLQGRTDRAVQDFDRAIKMDPSLAGAYMARGMAYRLQGDFSRALKDLNKVLSLDAADTAALINRAALFFDVGEHERALQDLDRIIQINPRMIRALGNRAYISEQLGRYDDAIKDLTDIISQDPENLMAIKHLGFIYRQKDEPSKALRWFRMALKLETNNNGRKRLSDEIAELESRAQK